jgi:hypothetical protein
MYFLGFLHFVFYLLERYHLPAGTVSDSTAALSRQVPVL